jgi:CYTH domain-containing protein
MLTIKGPGQLSREEVNIPIDIKKFVTLQKLVPGTFISREYQEFTDGTYLYSCSHVDGQEPNGFWYCEVEFESEEAANAFVPPAWLGEEVTYQDEYKMKNYWLRNHAFKQEGSK